MLVDEPADVKICARTYRKKKHKFVRPGGLLFKTDAGAAKTLLARGTD